MKAKKSLLAYVTPSNDFVPSLPHIKDAAQLARHMKMMIRKEALQGNHTWKTLFMPL